MAFEDQNPTRRYRGFHPRQAARGTAITSNVTGFPTVALFNNSTAAQLLVVRDLSFQTQTDFSSVGMFNGRLAGTPGQQGNYFPSGGALPGLVDWSDQPNALPYDWEPIGSESLGGLVYPHDWPIAVLEPGWSLFVQCRQMGASEAASFIWEAVYPEELDFVWGF